jgi:hypothetical protein
MEKINQFSLQRFILLMKRHMTLNHKTWLTGFAAIGGLLIIISQFQIFTSGGVLNLAVLVNTGTTFILIGGFLLTSMAYNELHSPARSQFLLILPATNLEKLLSHWFVTSFLYVALANIALFLSVLVASIISALVYGSTIEFFNPFTEQNARIMGTYIVIQSIFLLGALYFRRNNLLKTLLAIFLVMMVLSMWSGLIVYILGVPSGDYNAESVSPVVANFFEFTLPRIAGIIFWVVLAPFFLIVSYFTLKEREV